ncbi:MAG: ECF transporter S component [Oscillospiraceae bacterium]|nr:ECF transporter S component [Oscillospiraceae bacterium]
MKQTQPTSTNRSNLTKLVVTALLAAVAVALQYLEFPVPLVPSFLQMDLSDIPELIGAFIVGPVGGVVVALLKNLIHLPVTKTAGVGELANFLLGAAFAFTAGIIYKRHKTKKTALIACCCGTVAMAAVSFPINYFIVYPFYAKLFGGMEPILGMYQAILPYADTLPKALLIFNVPFTLVKGILCVIVTMLVYKPLSNLINELNKKITGGKKN